MLVHSIKEFADKCETIMDVVPKDATEDNADFMGAVAQAAADGKKEFEFPPGSGKMYPVTLKDKSVGKKIAKKMDDEEQEEDMDLGDRVKARMNSQNEDDGP